MAIRITCPSCKETLSVGDELRGKKTTCKECGKALAVPAAKNKANPDKGSPDSEGIIAKKSREAVKPPPRSRAARDEDDDEEDERRRRKKQAAGSKMGLWLACAAAVILVGGGVAFFLLRSGGSSNNQVAQKPPETSNNPNPPSTPSGENQPGTNPPATNPPTTNPPVGNPPTTNPPSTNPPATEPKTDPPATKPPEKDPAPNNPKTDPPKNPDQPVVIGGAMTGEKIYQRLLKSTVFIMAEQKTGLAFVPKNPGGNPLNPGGNPLNPGGNPLNPGGNPLNPGGNPLNPGGNPLNPGGNPLNPGGNPLNPNPNPLNPNPLNPNPGNPNPNPLNPNPLNPNPNNPKPIPPNPNPNPLNPNPLNPANPNPANPNPLNPNPNPANPNPLNPNPNPLNPPNAGQGDNLAGTTWVGSETLRGFGKLEFQFMQGNGAIMIDVQGRTNGNYNQVNRNVTITFDGNVTYKGAFNGKDMSGDATNGKDRWTWKLVQQGGGGGGQPGLQPPAGAAPGIQPAVPPAGAQPGVAQPGGAPGANPLQPGAKPLPNPGGNPLQPGQPPQPGNPLAPAPGGAVPPAGNPLQPGQPPQPGNPLAPAPGGVQPPGGNPLQPGIPPQPGAQPPGGLQPPGGVQPPGGFPKQPGGIPPGGIQPPGGQPPFGQPPGGQPPGGGFLGQPGGTNSGKPSVVVPDIATGTGSLIDRKHRLIVTNVHVVGDATSLKFYFPEFDKGELVAKRDQYQSKPGIMGKVVAENPQADLALVQLERLPDGFKPLPLVRSKVLPAQQVHSLGNPGVSKALWVYSPGKVRQVFHDKWKVYNDLEDRFHHYEAMKLETDSAINPGDSGGPLVNDRCSLVGVTHASNFAAQNVSIFIEVAEVRALVEKYYKSIGETWQPEPEVSGSGEVNVTQLTDCIKKLSDKDFGARVQAAKVLGSMGPDASLAFGPLFNALKDSEQQIVKQAVGDALEQVPPHKGDVSLLSQACRDEGPMEIRLQAARSVGKLGALAKPALPALVAMLKTPNDELRLAALASIQDIGPDGKDAGELAKLLKGGSPEVRGKVLDVLVLMGPDAKKAVPDIVALLKNSDLKTRLLATGALASLGTVAKDAASGPLADALKDKNGEVALKSAYALIKMGETKGTIGLLTATLKTGSNELKQEAAKAIGELGPEAKSALTALANALEDDPVRPYAVESILKLGKMSAPAVCTKLTALLKTNSQPKARLTCIVLLAKVGEGSRQALETLLLVSSYDQVEEHRMIANAIGLKLSRK